MVSHRRGRSSVVCSPHGLLGTHSSVAGARPAMTCDGRTDRRIDGRPRGAADMGSEWTGFIN